MNEAINTIKQKYGDLCRLCPPLEEEKYPLAEKTLPTEYISKSAEYLSKLEQCSL